jgi:uncharacterized repeat protein (TIGR03803 family)
MLARGLSAGAGVVLAFSSWAEGYHVLHEFSGGLGGSSPSGALLFHDGALYGTTAFGGPTNHGTIFCLAPDGGGYSVLKSFTGNLGSSNADGAFPQSALITDGRWLYGTTAGRPLPLSNGCHGTVYRLSRDGEQFLVIKNFFDRRANPIGALHLAGSTLYGMARFNASNANGMIFRVQSDGTGYEVLHGFSGLNTSDTLATNYDGAFPSAGLIEAGGRLCGVASQGGLYGAGTVHGTGFNGENFTVLKHFSGGDGRSPAGPVTVHGGVLYGATSQGGSYEMGTVFRMEPDGANYTVLANLDGTNGSSPNGGLASDGTWLYGTTRAGGISNLGTVFRIGTNGSGFSVLHEFVGADGSQPRAGPVFCGGNLYGVAYGGGSFSCGVVFKLSLYPPSIIRAPREQTAESGETATLAVLADGSMPLEYHWLCGDANCGYTGTNCQFILPGLGFGQSGSYRVVVSNELGVAASAPAFLSVIAPVERRGVLALSLDGGWDGLAEVEYAGELGAASDWRLLEPGNQALGSGFCFDVTFPQPTSRFYRARLASGGFGSGNLILRPAAMLTLKGNVGESWQVDYIPRFGPTNAWRTLGTATLTNGSQPFFDLMGGFGPERLYRLIPGS